MIHFILKDPVLMNSVLLLASLAVLFKAADLLIEGISGYAKKLGLSDYIIGLAVVASAASMPEVMASLIGFLTGKEAAHGMGFGSILGTIMVHMALVVGLLVIIGGKMNLESEFFGKKAGMLWFLWAIIALPFVLMADGRLSRVDGAILVAVFIFYLALLWRQEGTLGRLKKRIPFSLIWKDAVVFLGSLIALLIAGIILVFSVKSLAFEFGVPAYLMAVAVIGVGAALPDFAVGLRGVLKGHTEIGVGDVIGSTVIELLLYFGIFALASPIRIDWQEIRYAAFFIVASAAVLMFLINKKIAYRRHGIVLLALYIAFIGLEISKAIGTQ